MEELATRAAPLLLAEVTGSLTQKNQHNYVPVKLPKNAMDT